MKFRKLLRFFFGIWLLITMNFFLIRSLPGSPLERFESLSPAVDKKWIEDLHLSETVFRQYTIYLGKILQGDLGPSITYVGSSVQKVILDHASVTMFLNLLALFLVFVLTGVLIQLSLGAPGSWTSRLSVFLTMAIVSSPSVLLAPVLILIFSVHLGWLPAAFLSTPAHFILPALVLALRPSVYLARQLTSLMEDEIRKDYVRTAKAKGLSEHRILFRHVLKNSIVPVLSYMGPLCVGLLSGSAFVEIIFAVPGLGSLFVESLRERDYFLSSGLVLIFGTLLLFLSFVFEWLATRIDIRLEESHETPS